MACLWEVHLPAFVLLQHWSGPSHQNTFQIASATALSTSCWKWQESRGRVDKHSHSSGALSWALLSQDCHNSSVILAKLSSPRRMGTPPHFSEVTLSCQSRGPAQWKLKFWILNPGTSQTTLAMLNPQWPKIQIQPPSNAFFLSQGVSTRGLWEPSSPPPLTAGPLPLGSDLSPSSQILERACHL